MSTGKIQLATNLLSEHWLKIDDFSLHSKVTDSNSDLKSTTYTTLKQIGANKSDTQGAELLFKHLDDLRVSLDIDTHSEETILAELECFIKAFNDDSIPKEAKLLAIRQVSLNLQYDALDRCTCLSAIFALKMAKSGQQQLHQDLLNQLLNESIEFIKTTRHKNRSAPLTERHCYELKKLVAQKIGFDLGKIQFNSNMFSRSPIFLAGEKDRFVECVSIMCGATNQIGYLASQLERKALHEKVDLDCTAFLDCPEPLKLVPIEGELKSGELKDSYRSALIDHFLPSNSLTEGEQEEPQANTHGYQVFLSFKDHRIKATEKIEGELLLMTKHGLRLQISDSRGGSYSPNLNQLNNVCIKSLPVDKKLLLGLQFIEQVSDLESCIDFNERYLSNEDQFPKCVVWQLKKSIQARIEQLLSIKAIPELEIFPEKKITEVVFDDFALGIKMEFQFRELMTFEALDDLKYSDISMLWPDAGDTDLSIKRKQQFQQRLEEIIGSNPCAYQPIYEKHFQAQWHEQQFKQLYELAGKDAFKKHIEQLDTEEALLAVIDTPILNHGDEQHLVDFYNVYVKRLANFYKPSGIPVSHLVKIYQQPLSTKFKEDTLKIAFIACMCGALPKLDTQERLFEFVKSFTNELALLGDASSLNLVKSFRKSWAEMVRNKPHIIIEEAAMINRLKQTESVAELLLLEPLVVSDTQWIELIRVFQAKEINSLIHHSPSLQAIGELSGWLPEKTLANYVSKEKIKTLAMEAAKTNQLDVLKYLLKEGADINDADANGYTLLHHAIEQKHADIFKFIIEKKEFNYSKTHLRGTKNVYQLAKHLDCSEMVSELERVYPRFKPRSVHHSSPSSSSSGGYGGSDIGHFPGVPRFTDNGAVNLLLTQAALAPAYHGHHHHGGGFGHHHHGGFGGGGFGGGGFGY